MHNRTPALLGLVVGIVPALGCGNPSSAPENSNLGPPVILENRIVLDSSAKLGWLRLVTQDPDGPVAVECGGAFEGAGEDSLVVSRPFADLRSQRYLSTACNATQGDTTVTTFAIMEDEYPLDNPAVLEPPDQPTSLRVGVPSAWPVRATDDWALGEVWFGIAPGHFPDCTTHWTRVATLVGAGRTVIDTTLTATFDTAGFHCVVIGAEDDLSQGRATSYEVEVSP